jgi:hypothetical protein
MKHKLILCLALVLSGGLLGCSTATHHSAIKVPREATASECERLYLAWHQECERIGYSSNTYDYIGLPSYRKIVAIDKPALPFLEHKMVQDKGLDFMLAFAVVEICGWDRQEFRGGSEQDFRDKVLKKLRANQ